MIQQIDGKEIISVQEAMREYSEFFIGFVIVEQNLRNPYEEKGYVLFLADTYDEGLDECMEMDLDISVLRGYSVDEPVEVGGLEVVRI